MQPNHKQMQFLLLCTESNSFWYVTKALFVSDSQFVKPLLILFCLQETDHNNILNYFHLRFFVSFSNRYFIIYNTCIT